MRVVRTVLIATAFGAVATVASTAVCGLVVSLKRQSEKNAFFFHIDPFDLEWELHGECLPDTGAVQYWLSWYGEERRARMSPHDTQEREWSKSPERTEPLPAWVQTEWMKQRRRGPDTYITLLDARGWTFPCFYSVSDGNFRDIIEHGIRIPGKRAMPTESFAIPYLPIWDRIALNVLFYSGICFILLTTLRFTRRGLRSMRGRCPECAYRLPASHQQHSPGCPECGWKRMGQ